MDWLRRRIGLGPSKPKPKPSPSAPPQKPKRGPEERLSILEESVELWRVEEVLEWLSLKKLDARTLEPLLREFQIDGDGLLDLGTDIYDVLREAHDRLVREEGKTEGNDKDEGTSDAAALGLTVDGKLPRTSPRNEKEDSREGLSDASKDDDKAEKEVVEEVRRLKAITEAPKSVYLEKISRATASAMSKWAEHKIPPMPKGWTTKEMGGDADSVKILEGPSTSSEGGGADDTKKLEVSESGEAPAESSESELEQAAQLVEFYHFATWNTERGGARSLSRDWLNQPRCYRRFWGAPIALLPIVDEAQSDSKASASASPSTSGSASSSASDSKLDRPPAIHWQSPSYNSLFNVANNEEHAEEEKGKEKEKAEHEGAENKEKEKEKQVTQSPLDVTKLSTLLYYALSVTGRKEGFALIQYVRGAWSKRVNPSSGGLHPIEAYALLPPLPGLSRKPGVYHYSPRDHALEKRTSFSEGLWKKFAHGLPEHSFFVALTTINWREVWKYGERGFRYCQLDVGHALGSLRFAAAMAGYRLQVIGNVDDRALCGLIGTAVPNLIENDAELPALLAVLYPQTEVDEGNTIQGFEFPVELIAELQTEAAWLGRPNSLSWENLHWNVVDAVTQATLDLHRSQIVSQSEQGDGQPQQTTSATDEEESQEKGKGTRKFFEPSASAVSGPLIRKRRSALNFAEKSITFSQFASVLARVVPSFCSLPSDALLGRPINIPVLAIYVFRVEGLDPGCYLLFRDGERCKPELETLIPNGAWKRVKKLPRQVPLYLLWKTIPVTSVKEPELVGAKKENKSKDSETKDSGNGAKEGSEEESEEEKTKRDAAAKQEAMQLASQFASCFQQIAYTSCFSLGMLAPLKRILRTQGPHAYRHIHWEAGLIGSVLYLEAEAQGLGATGMGCFLDNVALSHFGLYKATETKKKEAEKASTEDGDDKKKNKEKVSDDEGVEEEEPEDKPKQPQEGEKEAADGEQQREGEDNKKKKQEAKAEEGKETERRYGAPMGWEDFYHFTIGHKVRDERVSLYTYDRHMLAEALVD